MEKSLDNFLKIGLFISMNPSNFFFFLCAFREHKENWQKKEVSSFVLLRQRDVGALCVPSMASSGEAGTEAEDKRTACTSPTWYLTEVPGWVEFSCHSSFLFPVLVTCFHIIRKYLNDTKLSVVTSLTWRPQRQLQNSAAEDKVGLLKVLQTLHSYQVTI